MQMASQGMMPSIKTKGSASVKRFDREILPYGPGTRQRAGLIAVAVK